VQAALPFYPDSFGGPPANGGQQRRDLDGHEPGGWPADPARGTGGPRAPPGPDET
jgi:hypothetical protein